MPNWTEDGRRRSRCGLLVVALGLVLMNGGATHSQQSEKNRVESFGSEVYPKILDASRRYAETITGSNSSAEYYQTLDEALRGATQHLARRRDGSGPQPTPASPDGRKGQPVEGTIFDNPKWQKNMQLIIEAPAPAGGGASPRIYGGVPAKAGEYPACVGVGRNGRACCTGTLVGKNVVVTAAHCVDGGCARKVFFGEDSNVPGSGTEIGVSKAIAHPDFSKSKPLENDIAILVMKDEAPPGVAPVEIANAAEIDAAATFRAVGFGITETGDSGVKWVVDVATATPNCSGIGEASMYHCFAGRELVAGGNGFDTCNGDSGGPYFVMRGAIPVLAGATSRKAGNTNLNCGGGGIAVRVDTYWSWIETTAKANGGKF